MSKLNLSRGLYYKSALGHLLSLPKEGYPVSAENISEVLGNQIESVYRQSKDGYWGVTGCDMAFIRLLGEAKSKLFHDSHEDIFKEALDNIEGLKLKIVFFAQETVCWPSLESLYIACKNDDRFTTQLVYVPFVHANADKSIDYYAIYKDDMGLPIIPHDEYSLADESPDIAVFVKPYDSIPRNYYIDDVCKVVPRCIYVRYGFEIAAYNVDLHFRLPTQCKAWKFIAYGDKVKELAQEYSPNTGKNVVVWGHPRADYYQNPESSHDGIPDEWKQKIDGRTAILWNTQHTVRVGEGSGTFPKWKNEVFQWFDNHKDSVLLWRPHPLMFGALVNYGLMTQIELDEMIQVMQSKDNVILDRSPDYRNAIYASDAIITDGTAFLIEYFYTGRPIIFTPKDNAGGIYFQNEICENVYVAEREGDLAALLGEIRRGYDPMKERRQAFAKKLLKVNPEGNGEYIKNQIYSELVKECIYDL